MRNWDGLVECENFLDFWRYLNTQPKEQFRCPECGGQMEYKTFTSFNLLKAGEARFSCQNQKCHFYFYPIKVQAVEVNSAWTGFRI